MKSILPRTLAASLLVLASCGSPGSQPAESPSPEPAPEPLATPEPPTADAPEPEPADAPPDAEGGTRPRIAPPLPATPRPGSPREKLMRAHFHETELIRNAIINGDLSAAVAPGEALAKALEGKKFTKGKVAASALREASVRVTKSPDISAVAAAAADIGVACGTCHRSTVVPKVEFGTPPDPSENIKGRMRRHTWGTDRLWEGLYVPSDAAWNAGVEALKGDPFPKEVLKQGGVHARSAADRLKKLVEQAETKKKPAERAAIYAALLQTCASCHSVSTAAK